MLVHPLEPLARCTLMLVLPKSECVLCGFIYTQTTSFNASLPKQNFLNLFKGCDQLTLCTSGGDLYIIWSSGCWNRVVPLYIYSGVLISGCWNRVVPLYVYSGVFISGGWNRVVPLCIYRVVLISGCWNRVVLLYCSTSTQH